MKGLWRFALLATASLLLAPHSVGADSTAPGGYGYPIQDGFLSSIVGAPPDETAELADEKVLETREIVRFPSRKVPSVFLNRGPVVFGFSRQEGPAPLIFVIAGTGASHREGKVLRLQRLFHLAGFHVVAISSPTNPEFMLSASRYGMPGRMATDVRDLYETMQLVLADVGTDIEITDIHLTGYSLGGTQSAFLARLDEDEGKIGFGKILLINPAVNLFTSAGILDRLVEIGLPNGTRSFERLVQSLLSQVADHVQTQGRAPMDDELLYRIAEAQIAKGEAPPPELLRAIVGAAFRLAGANIIYVADVLHGGGHVVAPGDAPGVGMSTTPAFKRAVRWSLRRYLDEMLVPFWQAKEPGLDRETMIARASLAHLREYLSSSPNISVVTNADDFILTAEDLEFLRDTFGERALIYPEGGHCGNLLYRENAEYLVKYFRGSRVATAEPAPHAAVVDLASMEAAGGEVRDWGTAPAATQPMIRVGREPIDRFDPVEGLNRYVHRFNAEFDRFVFLPALRAWRFVMPSPVRRRWSSFLANLGEIPSFMNSVAQLSARKSGGTLARFAVNSTVGVAGLWDPATRLGLPGYGEDFGQTLGHYGVPPGPYLVLPVAGPSSLRDAIGSSVDRFVQLLVLNAATNDWVDDNPYVFVPEALQSRGDTPFRYGELAAAFEYELLRYFYLEYRILQIEN